MTLRAVEVVALIAAPSVAVAARAIVIAVVLVKLEVVALSKVLVVLVVAGILVVVVVAFSRNERTHPSFFSQATQAREIENFLWTGNWPSCRFLQGLWVSFSCPSVTLCLLSFVASFVVFRLFGGFFEANWFLTLIAFDKKDKAVPMQSGVRVFGRAKTNYIIAKHVYTRRFLRDHSFLGVFILDRAGLFGQDVR